MAKHHKSWQDRHRDNMRDMKSPPFGGDPAFPSRAAGGGKKALPSNAPQSLEQPAGGTPKGVKWQGKRGG